MKKIMKIKLFILFFLFLVISLRLSYFGVSRRLEWKLDMKPEQRGKLGDSKDFSVNFSSFTHKTDVKWFEDTFRIFYDWLDEKIPQIWSEKLLFYPFYSEGDTCETGFRTAASKLVLVEPFGADYGEIFELKNYFIGAGDFQNYDYVKCEIGEHLWNILMRSLKHFDDNSDNSFSNLCNYTYFQT